jgi:hypothetical protein
MNDDCKILLESMMITREQFVFTRKVLSIKIETYEIPENM